MSLHLVCPKFPWVIGWGSSWTWIKAHEGGSFNSMDSGETVRRYASGRLHLGSSQFTPSPSPPQCMVWTPLPRFSGQRS